MMLEGIMRLPAFALATVAILTIGPAPMRLSASSDTTTKSIQAHVEVAARSSLIVTSELLQFHVTEPGQAATATVDYIAGIRTHAGAEVMLTVEAIRGIDDTTVTFANVGEGGVQGTMLALRPVIAGRWIGSGRRTGRISFSLLAAAPGAYSMPVRFVLSAP
jgi:hypothetical protein